MKHHSRTGRCALDVRGARARGAGAGMPAAIRLIRDLSAKRSAQLLTAAFAVLCLNSCAENALPLQPDTAEAAADHAAGLRALRSQSYYLEMRDGVRLALSLYFPGGAEPTTPAPVILFQTRYGRAGVLRAHERRRFLEDGYVIATLDTRGSTSSFGPRRVDIGPAEVEDMDEVIAHLAAKPWSNGNIFVQGASYLADTADVATSRPAKALKGAVIRQVDFDAYAHLFFPGGVPNDWFLKTWGAATKAMDEGRSPDPSKTDLDCMVRIEDCRALWPVLDPVDGDEEFELLRDALAGRDRWGPDDYVSAVFIDDKGDNGHSLFESSPAYQLDGIRRESKPAQIWGSWMDAGTAAAALARYRSAPDAPMHLWITANDHSNRQLGDPLLPEKSAPVPSMDDQYRIISTFYEKVSAGENIGRRINYYILGAGKFESTIEWPPKDVVEQTLYFGTKGALDTALPTSSGQVRYEVDFAVSTGDATRWSTQFGTPPSYSDRRYADERLAVFETAPMQETTDIVGEPVVRLFVAAQSKDPAFFVYLEDVAPDGRVTYITEGALRAIHRKLAEPNDLFYTKGPAPHSFQRKDSMSVIPGELMHVKFALNPVAARIKKGHRLRVAIAGADACCFRRLSEGAADQYAIHYGGAKASAIQAPMRRVE